MGNIKPNTQIKYKSGQVMSMLDLAVKYAGYDPIDTAGIVALGNALEKRGDITIHDTRSQQEKKIGDSVENAINEEAFNIIVNNIAVEEQAHKEYVREQKKQETGTHTFDLAFTTTLEATNFELWINQMGISDTTIIQDPETGAIKLYVKEVTPQEYTKITTRYLAESKINGAMQATGKVLVGATNAVNYGLANVVAPTAKIAGEASMNLAKGIFHTGAKTLAGLVNSGAKAVADTKIALQTDAECLRATNQLMNAKNDIKRGITNKLGNSNIGNGITTY